MAFSAKVRAFRSVPPRFSLVEAWNISEAELSSSGRANLITLSSQANYSTVAWEGQALIEFQDLQFMPVPSEGPFLNAPYLFCEGLSVLREAVIGGINGQIHISLAALRTVLELFSFHYWWKQKLFGKPTYQTFADWLVTGRGSPPFKNAVKELYAHALLPPQGVEESQFLSIYESLCAYVHKPLLHEAIATRSAGNDPLERRAVLTYWLSSLHRAQRATLEIAISQDPISLFPKHLERKFGFSPPAGIFFDHANFLPLEQALGSDVAKAYQAHYRDLDPPKTQLDWYSQWPDLSREEILSSWWGKEIDDKKSSYSDRVHSRFLLAKAQLRAGMWFVAYDPDSPTIAELIRERSKDVG